MRLLKSILKWFGLCFAVVLLGFTFWVRDRYTVPILTYHNVSIIPSTTVSEDFTSAARSRQHLNNVTPKSFAWQMKFLKRHGYRVISFEDLVHGMKQGMAFDRNTVVIQFDDGYEDNYIHAFPVLKRYSFPAMVFVVSDRVGQPGFITWAQAKEMDANGFKIGSHTRFHAYLPHLSHADAVNEIAGSKKVIEQNLGHQIDYFAYPSGGFTEEVQGIVEQSGYKAAVTTNRGRDPYNRDLYAIRRIRVKDTENAITLWAKLSGYYNLFRKAKDGY